MAVQPVHASQWPNSDPCPRWCAARHAPTDHAEDWVHESAGQLVEVRLRTPGGQSEAADVAVYAFRNSGERESWLHVGVGPRERLIVRLEDGLTLLSALRNVLGDVAKATLAEQSPLANGTPR